MAKRFHPFLRRLHSDFQLSIITLMSLFGVLAITPYAIYRLLEGNYLVGLADTTIVLSTLIAVRHAWRTGDTVKPGIYLAIIFSAGALVITINLGINGLFWIYPLILFNFFMASPSKALSATVLVLGLLVAYAMSFPGRVFESTYQMLSFLVTGLMGSMLTFVFAYRTRSQREQLQILASHDALTGARNRRAMNDELTIISAAFHRNGGHYALLLMDLDHFKQINDRFGHQAGDRVLIRFADIVRQSSRQEDRLFRFGGEEFLLLLPNTDEAGLAAAAEQLQQRIAERLDGPNGPVTVSMGGARLRPNEHWESWLQRADQRLYRAKTQGRNRIVLSDE